MTFYRYEIEDGGGPFFTKDGVLRTDPSIISSDNTLSVCASEADLHKWFDARGISTEGLIVSKYNGDIIHVYDSGEILIQKDTAVRFRDERKF